MTTVHWAVEALDAASAEESIRTISPHTVLGRNPDPRHRLRLDGDDRFSLLRLEVAGEMWGNNAPDDTITIPFAPRGRHEWEVGDERGTSQLPWLQGTTQPTFSTFGPVQIYSTFLPRKPLLRLARALYGDDRLTLRFTGSTARSPELARTLASTLHLAYELAPKEAFEQPLVRASLYRLLAVTVLETFRLDGDHTTRTLTAQGRQARYRQASQFIDDYASLPITLEDIAAAVEVSTPELDTIFRGHSPLGHGTADQLRATRLAAAHEDLKRGDPTLGDTVRDIAQRWGFASPSRFATHYRNTYGVNPKWVLDR